ncbi:hypothetical protein ABZS66_19315 [Dactylosporangium sp. NPDC005572]|uniref:hypothetical protein n=1 Tax=Dactylosporangium sp. NPDC005572 TaxID=3156889 RepID=UPI00339ED2FD
MHRITRYVIAAGAVSVAASLGAANPAAAAPAGKPVRCYQQSLERAEIGHWPAGKNGHTDPLVVAAGSPCRDINVRQVRDVDGKAACRKLRVRWASGNTTGWKRVCRSWTVIARNASEGASFQIEAQGRPASVGVRS